MQDFERYRLIEQYLNGELSPSERMRFEESIAQDPALAQEVELYTLTNEVVFENRLLDIKQKIKADFSNNNTSPGWNKYIIAAIIGLALIAGIGGYMYSSKEDSSSTTISQQEEKRTVVQQENSAVTNGGEHTTSSIHSKSNSNTNSNTNTNSSNTVSPARTDSIPVSTGIAPPTKTQTKDDDAAAAKADHTTKTNPVTPQGKTDPCANISITAEFKLTPACKGAATGEIQVLLSKTAGGKAPYAYALNDESFGMESYFNDLKKGTYSIHVKDQNNCSQVFSKEIKEVSCVQPLDDYSFNPTRGQTWKYENKSMNTAHIQILDKSGTSVKSYSVQSGQQVEWDGKSDQGNDVQMGGYVCMITYDNGAVEKGMIIIYQ